MVRNRRKAATICGSSRAHEHRSGALNVLDSVMVLGIVSYVTCAGVVGCERDCLAERVSHFLEEFGKVHTFSGRFTESHNFSLSGIECDTSLLYRRPQNGGQTIMEHPSGRGVTICPVGI